MVGQAAYRAWASGDYVLTPFARYEQYNTAASYAGMPPGLGVATGPDEKLVTFGANLKVGEGVVLKADYQKFRPIAPSIGSTSASAIHSESSSAMKPMH